MHHVCVATYVYTPRYRSMYSSCTVAPCTTAVASYSGAVYRDIRPGEVHRIHTTIDSTLTKFSSGETGNGKNLLYHCKKVNYLSIDLVRF